jgi:hypothetical protein
VFHSDATARFNELGNTLRDRVRVVQKTRTGPATRYSPYPVGRFGPEDVIGRVVMTEHVNDGLGREVGRLWTLRGESVGLIDNAYQELKSLAEAMAKTAALRGRVDVVFLVDEISLWIQAALEGKTSEALVTCISRRCQEAIKEYEVWVPLFRVYASDPFQIGDVLFQKITPAMMDRFFTKPTSTPIPEAARVRLGRLRSELQNHLAACITVTGEKKTAQGIARSKAEGAVALVRFLSPANWILDFQSYCLPLGRERIEIPTELFVAGGEIHEISRGTIERGPVFWDLDPDTARFPGLLDLLHALCRDHASDFRHQLYDALMLYSRNSTASGTTDKLVFVLVSLESMLLKDANEPISKNIGERMAFLVGDSVEERRAVVRNVDAAYRIRSKFIHHGESAEDSDVVEQFCAYAWQSFHALLHQVDAFTTKAALIEALEHRKLA